MKNDVNWKSLALAGLGGAAIFAVTLMAGTHHGFQDGRYETLTYSYPDEAGNRIKLKEVLTVKGDTVNVAMMVWSSDTEPGPSSTPVLNWRGKVVDASKQLLTVKREVGVDRRFFRVRDDGRVEELTLKKEFKAAPVANHS